MARSVILEGEGESIDGSYTTLVRVIPDPDASISVTTWPSSPRPIGCGHGNRAMRDGTSATDLGNVISRWHWNNRLHPRFHVAVSDGS